jgi:hypothetical protein
MADVRALRGALNRSVQELVPAYRAVWSRISRSALLAGVAWLLAIAPARGDDDSREDLPPGAPTPIEVVVIGRSESLLGEASSASEGRVGQSELEDRPLLRPAEVLESVPGMIVSQHSGPGKANQYYLRGFNLDHGTDFLTTIDGMPVNLPSHAHGHGYADLNFLIPELVQAIHYRKGPYYADSGDFSSVGSARIELVDKLPASIVSVTGGRYDYARGLIAGAPRLGEGQFLYALEGEGYDGPWRNDQDAVKLNGVLRYSQGDRERGFRVTALGYDASWYATDQVPLRAITNGSLPRLGTIDPTDGGSTSRYSLLANWHAEEDGEFTTVDLYGYRYELDLFSNFTYFLDDPINGDQFEQVDRRSGLGGALERQVAGRLAGMDLAHTYGMRLRHDSIPEVALHRSRRRARLETVRSDDVQQTSAGVYGQSEAQALEYLRVTLGVAGELYRFEVDDVLPQNSGQESATMINPKFGVIAGPWADTELYLNLGSGFHSNDARGTTTRVDPADPTVAVDPVTPLARTKGGEIGVRTAAVPGLVSSVSLWLLDLDSELLFLGDAGTTEPSRASRRYGIELSNFYRSARGITVDADLSLSHARFRDASPEGDYVPGAIESVLQMGVGYDYGNGFFSDIRLRHFGPRALVEDDSVRSKSTSVVNARIGHRTGPMMGFQECLISLDLLNLFDSHDSDIDYFYRSRLPGEPRAGVDDIHLHPVEPLSYRITVTLKY